MRPTIRTKTEVAAVNLDLTAKRQTTARLAGPHLAARLKQKRSPDYVQSLTRLDAGTHAGNPEDLARVIAAIANEFADLELTQRPIGFVQKCILGPEYEVHILDPQGTAIVRHFKTGEAMPPPFERARTLAIHPGCRLLNTYAFIEIYPDRLVAVYADGPVTSVDPTAL